MRALLVLDKDAKTKLMEDMKTKLFGLLATKGHTGHLLELGRKDVNPCLGCWLCMNQNDGKCIQKDILTELRCKNQEYGMTIFLMPVLFGHFTATMKSVMDRGIGSREVQVMIGFDGNMTDEEKSTFIDLTAKHRGKADIVHPGLDKEVVAYVTASLEDNDGICSAVSKFL